MQFELQCALCKHLLANRKCKAFPKKIPNEIFATGEHDHTKPFDGDNGILFEPDEKFALKKRPLNKGLL